MSARIPRPARLDPVGRLRFPRRATTLRAVVVAVLLVTAAGVLHSGGSAGDRPGAAGTPPTAPAGTPGATGTPVPGAGVLGTVPAGGPLSQLPEEWTARERVPVPDGTVGVPLALPEPGALAMLRPGDRVDLLAVPAGGGAPAPVAQEVTVLAVDPGSATVLLSLPPERAVEALSVPAGDQFAVVVRP